MNYPAVSSLSKFIQEKFHFCQFDNSGWDKIYLAEANANYEKYPEVLHDELDFALIAALPELRSLLANEKKLTQQIEELKANAKDSAIERMGEDR